RLMTHRRDWTPTVSAETALFSGDLETLYCRSSNVVRGVIRMAKKKTVSSPKRSAATKPAKDFAGVFAALKGILEPYEKDLHVLPYKPQHYCLVTRLAVHKGKPVWFA